MINLERITKSKLVTKVVASNNIYFELGNNRYTLGELFSEFIDNSIAGRLDDTVIDIDILIYYINDANGNRVLTKIIFRDNSGGIEQNILGKALSPASKTTKGSLNEHGMGMKQATYALGEFSYLATKRKGEEKARIIFEMRYGDIDTYYTDDFEYTQGTEICVKNIKSSISNNPTYYAQNIVPYLGARYRYFLQPKNKKINLSIKMINEDSDKVTNDWSVRRISPIYFNNYYRNDTPLIDKFPIKGKGWSAELTFGHAPANKYEYGELGVKEPKAFEPYYVSIKKQGIDVIMNGRVIMFHQLEELGIVGSEHPSLNTIRGELVLKKGFKTAITKNQIMYDKNFLQCIFKVKQILNGEAPGPSNQKIDYMKNNNYVKKLPHKLLVDRLGKLMINSPVLNENRDKDIHYEFTIEGIDGHIDFLLGDTAWELKTEQASAQDVYQLFMYMDIGNITKGCLVAKSISPGAKYCADFINKNHGKHIILDVLNNYAINDSPSAEERKKYFK